MTVEEYRRTITTIQLSKEIRDFLRVLTIHSKCTGYDKLFKRHIIPLIKKEAGSGDPIRIGAHFSRRAKRKS